MTTLNNEKRSLLAKEAVRQSGLPAKEASTVEKIRNLEQAIMKELLGWTASNSWNWILSNLNDTIRDVQAEMAKLPPYLQQDISEVTMITKCAIHYKFLVEGKQYNAMLGLMEGDEEDAFIRPSCFYTSIGVKRDSAHSKMFLNQHRKLESIRNAMEDLESTVFMKIKSYRTTEQMIKGWPESIRLMPALEESKSTSLVIADESVNKLIWG